VSNLLLGYAAESSLKLLRTNEVRNDGPLFFGMVRVCTDNGQERPIALLDVVPKGTRDRAPKVFGNFSDMGDGPLRGLRSLMHRAMRED
jgi:hypothetical protein